MKLRDFLKLLAMAMILPMAFVACSDDDEPKIPESVTLNEIDVDMLMGGTLQLTATVAGNDSNSTTVTWTSSNPAVATVDNNGLVTAVAPGEAVITASFGNVFATCEVEVDAEDMLLVFNSGSMYNSIDGSLSAVKFEKSQTVSNNVFSTANGRSLGATVQDGIIFGDNLYIAVDGSNTIEVVNKYSFKSVATILPDQTAYEPRDIVADDNYIYVSMYTGYVARINPASNTIDKTVQVGPNPEEMVIEDGYLYVANSDGMNYGNNYENGKTVSKINLSTFTEEKKINVGLNPTAIQEADDKIFVLCMGNYADVPASLYVIDKNDNVTDSGIPASFFAAEDDVLYVVDSPWGGSTSYVSYNAKDLSVISDSFVKDVVDAPAGIAVEDDRIFISSYNLVNGYASYSTDGYVNEYRVSAAAVYPPEYGLVKKYDVGVGPVHMLVVD